MVTGYDPDPAFKAFADRTRRDILTALSARPMPVHELAERFATSRPAVSKHLKVLVEAGLIQAQRSGKENIYSIEDEALEAVVGWLARFWAGRLQLLKAMAEAAQ